MTMKEVIDKICKSMFLEQQELAKLLGISATSISLYRNGTRVPRLPVVRKILDFAKKNKVEVTLHM